MPRGQGVRPPDLLARRARQTQQLSDRVVCLDGVPERETLVDVVVGASAPTPSRDHSGFLELTQDPLDGALGDPDRLGDLTDADVRIPGDA